MNQVEIWLSILVRKLLRHGSFTNLTSVEFGNTQASGTGESNTSSLTFGGTVTPDGSVSVGDIVETGLLFTTEIKNTKAVTNGKTEQKSTTLAYLSTCGHDSTTGFVVSYITTYRAYLYTEAATDKEVWLRVPWDLKSENLVMERYYTRTGREGWVPIGGAPNIALGKPASQSSRSVFGGEASRAVDGDTDSSFHSVTSTSAGDASPWWQVDLGSAQYISGIRVWNRTDCCASRLANWQIKLFDTPGGWAAPKWTSPLQGQLGSPSIMIAVDKTARYVRIEKASPSLSLAEMEVLGAPLVGGRTTNLALNATASQSSTSGNAVAARAIDGNTDGASPATPSPPPMRRSPRPSSSIRSPSLIPCALVRPACPAPCRPGSTCRQCSGISRLKVRRT